MKWNSKLNTQNFLFPNPHLRFTIFSVDHTQREFLIEIEELVERLFVDLDRLQTSAAGESSPRKVRESIDQIFRTVHTIKGSAGSSGLDTVSGLTHEFENALDALRTGKIKFEAGLLETFVATAEALGESVRKTAAGTTAPSNSALIDQLRAAAARQCRSQPAGRGDHREA